MDKIKVIPWRQTESPPWGESAAEAKKVQRTTEGEILQFQNRPFIYWAYRPEGGPPRVENWSTGVCSSKRFSLLAE
jgi:hypothetical protein